MKKLNLVVIFIVSLILNNCVMVDDIIEKRSVSAKQDRWNEIGVKSKDIKYWKREGVKTPEEAKTWIESGVEYFYEVDRWESYAGVTTPEKAKRWIDAGFTSVQAGNYIEKGYLTLEAAITQREKDKLDAITQAEWDKLDINYFIQPSWKKTGLTPSEVDLWIKADMRDGFRWINAGVLSIKDTESWRAIGVHGGFISGLKKQGFKSSNQLKNLCGHIVDEEAFTSSSPFKYKNKCSAICLKVNQVLSANKIFGYASGKRAVSAKAPNNLIDDFVSGIEACGIYKITGTEKFNLLNGKSVMGNTLKRISSL